MHGSRRRGSLAQWGSEPEVDLGRVDDRAGGLLMTSDKGRSVATPARPPNKSIRAAAAARPEPGNVLPSRTAANRSRSAAASDGGTGGAASSA